MSCIGHVGGDRVLTDGCLTELLISHLIGNVGPHQHTHGDAKALPNHFRDELQPVGAFIYPLYTGWSTGRVPFMPSEGFPPEILPLSNLLSITVHPQRPAPLQPSQNLL